MMSISLLATQLRIYNKYKVKFCTFTVNWDYVNKTKVVVYNKIFSIYAVKTSIRKICFIGNRDHINKSEETRVVAYSCRYSSGQVSATTLVSSLFIYMIPIDCKITNFPYTCLFTFLNYACLKALVSKVSKSVSRKIC